MPCSQPENEPEAREHGAFYAHVPYSYFLRFMPLLLGRKLAFETFPRNHWQP